MVVQCLNDDWVEGTEPLTPLIHDYSLNLLLSDVQALDEAMLDKIHANATNEMNDTLLKPFMTEDVEEEVFIIGDYKAPCPDGLHVVLYKKFWVMYVE
jgi:hypothetical protein